MSNKPKNVKRISEYIKTPSERRYENILNQVMTFIRRRSGFSKHQGSKKYSVFRVLKNFNR